MVCGVVVNVCLGSVGIYPGRCRCRRDRRCSRCNKKTHGRTGKKKLRMMICLRFAVDPFTICAKRVYFWMLCWLRWLLAHCSYYFRDGLPGRQQPTSRGCCSLLPVVSLPSSAPSLNHYCQMPNPKKPSEHRKQQRVCTQQCQDIFVGRALPRWWSPRLMQATHERSQHVTFIEMIMDNNKSKTSESQ